MIPKGRMIYEVKSFIKRYKKVNRLIKDNQLKNKLK